MSTCVECGNYYRLSPFHKHSLKCEECAYVFDDEDAFEIDRIVNTSGKIQAVYNEEDLND